MSRAIDYALIDFSDQVLLGKAADRVFNNYPAGLVPHVAKN